MKNLTKKLILTSLMALMAFSSAFGQNGTLRAKFVKSTDGSPVTDATFTAVLASNNQSYGVRTPNAQGEMEWSLPPGNYYVKRQTGNYVATNSVTVTLLAGETNSTLVTNPTSLTPLAFLRAKFVKSTDGTPVTDATFTAVLTSNNQNQGTRTPDAQGEMEWALPPGNYYVKLLTGYYVATNSVTVTLIAGETNSTLVTNPTSLTPSTVLRAKFVKSTDGSPVTDATFTAVLASNNQNYGVRTPNAQGEMEWVLAPGNYYVKPITGNYVSANSSTVTLVAGETNSTLITNPTSLTPLATLRAKFVKSTDGTPVTDATFTYVYSAGNYSGTLYPDANGIITQLLPPGDFKVKTLSGNYVGYTSGTTTVTAGEINAAFVDTPRVLTPLGVKAHFVNSNNTAVISGKTVKITDGSNNTVATQTTNANGDVYIQLTPGSYTMTAFDNDANYQTQNIPITIPSNAVLDKGTINMAQNKFALAFNDAGDYVNAGQESSLNTISSFTIEAWVLRKSGGNSQHIISKGGGWGNNGVNIHFYYDPTPNPNPASTSLRVDFRGTNPAGWFFYNVDDQVGFDQWHHISIVWDRTTLTTPRVYVDGIYEHVGTGSPYSGYIYTDNYDINIGRNSSINSAYFKGNLDEVRWWNFARTQSEIQASMNTHLNGNESGLVLYYKLDEGSGSLINDIAGTNSQGTLMGNTSWLTTTFPHISGTMTKTLAGTFYESAYTDTTGEMQKDLSTIPMEFGLESNFPNPFNPTTTLRYALKEDVRVSLKVYNLLGQEVRNLVNEHQTAGFKNVLWDGKNNQGKQVPSGVYIYRLEAGSFKMSKKMNLIK
ncbi:MAG TPA: FlgD immunoglobulin-like domain containing protein [bacterium]|nr:FlgD immunoglobulin-like domain containing protein [bacterium]HMW31749.1 FlgD immunoglobulin-like domain containing protein [bacterium]HMW35325.1 FlgD immunoglobulin-like domain containing protein [bacterium]HMY35352.1 FlgD immunoglobulin-like domain containing protein [bacterium]HMZ03059.1 FlgD immunoglobulin-like domain containing protein [bacterium]